MEKKTLSKRILMSLFGVLTGAVSVAIFKIASFGVDPFQTFMAGLDALVPIQFGTLYMIANAVLFLFALVFDRHYIGIATFINLFLLGYVVEFSYDMFRMIPLFAAPTLWVRAVCLVVGIVLICFGSAFYITADLGVSTYDAVALIMANTWRWWKFKYIRIITDVVCVIIGCSLYLLAGGEVAMVPTIAGIGTIVTAFFMGPLIEFFNEKCARPFLYGKQD